MSYEVCGFPTDAYWASIEKTLVELPLAAAASVMNLVVNDW
jgi:hypothetical protein